MVPGPDVALLSTRFLLALTVFLVVMTNFLLLIGAGLFSKAVWHFQANAFNHLCAPSCVDSVLLETDIQTALVQMQTIRVGMVQVRSMYEAVYGTSTAATPRANWTAKDG
jgi:high-affinity Fe2+/Pb2+ permease